MTKNVTVRNTLTGKVASIPERIFKSPVFNPGHLILADENAKPFVGAYKPKTAEEFAEVHPDKVVTEPGDDKTENPEED